jgi:hypothetical protein
MDLSDNRKAAIAALLGLSSSTCFYSMNTTINYLTMPTIMLGRPATSPSQQGPFFVSSAPEPLSSHSHLVRQHQEILIRGGKYGAPSLAHLPCSRQLTTHPQTQYNESCTV